MTAIRKATGRITTAIVGTNSTRSRTISHRLLEASTSLEAWLRTCVVKIITPTKPNTARLRAATRRAIMREITRMSAFLPSAIRSDGLKAGKPCPHHGLPPSPIACLQADSAYPVVFINFLRIAQHYPCPCSPINRASLYWHSLDGNQTNKQSPAWLHPAKDRRERLVSRRSWVIFNPHIIR